MPCVHPLPAWRTPDGSVVLKRPEHRIETLNLPCGGCIGCRESRAREWALRCSLEAQDHQRTAWATLTYEEKYKPPTLIKSHLQGWLKRLRADLARTARRHSTTQPVLRFFAAGEYGERTHRPHYHAILFGIDVGAASQIKQAWPFGYAKVDTLTPARIAYTAGYCSKKIGWKLDSGQQRVDPDTGELYNYQAPFIQMSRRPGIGATARDAFTPSWREFAINQHGQPMPVPRYLHQRWKDTATEQELETLREKKQNETYEKAKLGRYTKRQLAIEAKLLIARHEQRAVKRNTL